MRGVRAARQVCDASKVRRDKDGVPIEAVITANMAHPNVVRTIAHAIALAEPGTGFSGARSMAVDCTNWGRSSGALSPRGRRGEGSPGSENPRGFLAEEPAAAPLPECWLLLEYADCGSLMEAVVRGLFRTSSDGPVNWAALLTTAAEIASGIAFLHARRCGMLPVRVVAILHPRRCWKLALCFALIENMVIRAWALSRVTQ